MKRYSTVSDSSNSLSRKDGNDDLSIVSTSGASGYRRFAAQKRINAELSEPLNGIILEPYGGGSNDPYFVFRSDLQNQLELLDECLADYLRTVDDIVSTFITF